jgi:hypothetical protein
MKTCTSSESSDRLQRSCTRAFATHMPAMNRIFLIGTALLVLFFIFSAVTYSELHIVALASAASDNTEKADKLGEEFQKQSPWFREKPESDESIVTPQPEHYLRIPEEKKEEETQGNPYCYYPYCEEQYPLCYDPDTGLYEYCYPADSFSFKFRFHSRKFRQWWDHERACPPGYFFKNNIGCARRE